MKSNLDNIVESLEGEIWIDIPGFEGLHKISNLARVKSVKKTVYCPSINKYNSYGERLFIQRLNANGYYDCVLSKDSKARPYCIHRLMALAWISNPENYPVIHHKNHDKLDNRIENLEWTTRKNNSSLAADNGKYNTKVTKEKIVYHKYTTEDVPDFYHQVEDLENEVWLDIKDFEGFYQVSNCGRIRSKTRISNSSKSGKSYKRILNSRIIRPNFTRGSYMSVGLHKNGKAKTMSLHRLVAAAFLENPDNLPEVNHIDSNPINNHVENLEWCSTLDNRLHAMEFGKWNFKGEKAVFSKLTNEKVLTIRANIENKSIAKLAAEFGVTRKCISNILNRRSWTHI